MTKGKFKIFAVWIAVAVAGAGSWLWFQRARQPRLSETLTSARTINDSEVQLPSSPSQILILNFWATWCGPCIQETPSLFEVAAAHPEITLMSVSEDDSQKDVKKFLSLYPNSQAANVFVVFDRNRRLSEEFAVKTYPQSFIFSGDLKLMRKINGAVDWRSSEMQTLLRLKASEN